MRLSRTAWLSLAIGIFIIAFALLYTINSGQAKEQKQLKDSLAMAQARLPKLVSEREDLESQLAQRQSELAGVESSLATAQAKFPAKVESIDYGEVLFGIADDYDLEVAKLTSEKPQEEKVPINPGDKKSENIIYTTTTFEVTLQAPGSPPVTVEAFEDYINNTIGNVLDFVNEVVTGGHFTSATIKSVDMKHLEPPEEEALEGAPKPSATIKLVIYSYEGE
jgi:cell division protein FtsB